MTYRHGNRVTPGSPDTPLTAPDMHRLRDTKADGNCLFRAFSVLLTSTEHAHRNVRLAIVQNLLDNEQLFIHNAALDCSDHNSMEDYIVAYQMRSCGWGGTTEIFALAHMLGRRVYNSVECLGAGMRIVTPSLTAFLTLQVVRRHCTSITRVTTVM